MIKGTNYYWVTEQKWATYIPCSYCGSTVEFRKHKKHIGKSSVGWTFALHVYPRQNINELKDWIKIWVNDDGIITKDEGDDKISIEVMLMEIIMRGNFTEQIKLDDDVKNKLVDDFLHWCEENPAELGINGLMRRRLGNNVLKHGEGTWDYCINGECS